MVSIVIPTYNEALRVATTIDRIASHFSRQSRSFEIIVVDSCSPDGTADVVRAAQPRVDGPVRLLTNADHWGKGGSVRLGMLAAEGDVLLMCDADLSTPIEEFDRLEAHLEEGCDVAVGSRALAASNVVAPQPWYRRGMGRTLNWLLRGLQLTKFRDTQCGFKAMTRRAAREVFERQTMNRFAFDVEVLWLAERLGLRIAEVPVVWRDDAESRVRPLVDSAWVLYDVMRLRLRRGPPPASGQSGHVE